MKGFSKRFSVIATAQSVIAEYTTADGPEPHELMWLVSCDVLTEANPLPKVEMARWGWSLCDFTSPGMLPRWHLVAPYIVHVSETDSLRYNGQEKTLVDDSGRLWVLSAHPCIR